MQYELTNVCVYYFYYLKTKRQEKITWKHFFVVFPKWQDNFVLCFATYSALINHSTVVIERFNYQAKEGHSCFAKFMKKGKENLL